MAKVYKLPPKTFKVDISKTIDPGLVLKLDENPVVVAACKMVMDEPNVSGEVAEVVDSMFAVLQHRRCNIGVAVLSCILLLDILTANLVSEN